MSEDKAPKDFQLIQDQAEADHLLSEGAKSFASTLIWTKDQQNVIRTHLTLFSRKDSLIWAWTPKNFDLKKFMRELEGPGGVHDCYFSVSLAWANIFFRTAFSGPDSAGLCFHAPERVYKVQRRKDLRYRIPEGHVLKLEFDDPLFPDQKQTKKVFDLSASGVSFLTDPSDKEVFVDGAVLKNVTFTIDLRKIVAHVEIRHSKEVMVQRKPCLKVGLIFKGMRPGDSQKIASYVFEESRKYFLRFI
ncbi:MAG: hypothetical protein A2428_09115 [Bdellovibrionales bacterium RIFOXYC1_FULL_54_43]|nr:MAG: hypothetical protein A2428_09115 [Bdellovibrionales bacterium RIFOXYC1_FULL_54_43]OFZ83576.1 MAG: hypothetical protein A2603_00380 [Bdellovibrionales bacterium RIFOXYD1_FULL_55_31]